MAIYIGEAAANLFVAVLLGAAVGLERQWRQRLAGLRTNSLVALGAASFLLFGRLALEDSGARIAAQVISGIGFLGAGVIFKEGLNVRGLNTAATLWCSAAVGLLAGGGLAAYAALVAAMVIMTNVALRPLVKLINRQPLDSTEEERHYVVTLACRSGRAVEIRAGLAASIAEIPDTRIREFDSVFHEGSDEVDINVVLFSPERRELALETLVASYGNTPGVRRAGWREDAVES